jgi:hypothetical protein
MGLREVVNRMIGMPAELSQFLSQLPSQLTRIETLAKNIRDAQTSDFQTLSAKLDGEKAQLDRIELDVNSPEPNATITPIVTLVGPGIVSITVGRKGELYMATVVKTGGPLQMDVSGFVDDKGNPVTDTDPAVYTTSDATIATVVNDPTNAQNGVITLTGMTTPVGTTVMITASFPAQVGGMPFSVVGNLVVIEPAAASAQAVITGPGVVPGA